MTATEELRRLLDERGVKWWNASPCKTKWNSPVLGGAVAVSEWNGKMVLDAGYVNVTPEQAIAATLGAEDAYTREDVESAFVSGYSLGCLPVGSDPTWDQNEQTVDEHMAEWGWIRKEATLGSGTCHVESSIIDTYEYNRWEYELSCGHTIIWEDSEPPRFCPDCGRRVE